MNCSMLQLVVCSSRGSGCGFVVVAVLFPCLLFVQFSYYESATSGQAGYCWLHGHGRVDLSSAKAGPCVFGHPRCQFMSTVMPFELLLYHKLIFAFFGFAVCSSCQNRSLFLCIVSSINVINSIHRIHLKKNILNLLLQQCIQGKGGSHLPLSLTNKRNFLCVSPRTSQCHQTVRSLQYLYFIKDGAKWTLAICSAALNTGSGTDRSLCSNWVVWKKDLLLLKSPVPNLDCSQWSTN